MPPAVVRPRFPQPDLGPASFKSELCTSRALSALRRHFDGMAIRPSAQPVSEVTVFQSLSLPIALAAQIGPVLEGTWRAGAT